jgi:LacI family transcriptional regulator
MGSGFVEFLFTGMSQQLNQTTLPAAYEEIRIGVWFDLATDFFRNVLGGIASRVNELDGWSLTVLAQRSEPDWLDQLEPDYLRCHAVVAVITNPRQLEAARRISPLLINISNRYFLPDIMQVSTDEEAVGRLAARYFLDRKIRNFGYYGAKGLNFSEERENAFGAGIRQAGCKVESYYRSPDEEALRRWLRGLPKPCGIFCMNDHFARRLIDTSLGVGLKIPDEISVIGVDDDMLENNLSAIPLSSVNLDSVGLGRRVVDLLEGHFLEGKKLPHRLRVPPLCVTSRQSSDFFHIPDPLVVRALKCMRQNVESLNSVKDLAEALNVHRRTLELHFSQTVDESVRTALLRARVERSQTYLATTDLPISEVMEKSGFNNQRAFAAAFRRLVGQTPSQYRKQVRDAAISSSGGGG